MRSLLQAGMLSMQEMLQTIQSWLQQWLAQNQEFAALCLLVFFSMWMGGLLWHMGSTAYRRWKVARRFHRGLVAEKQAAKYLRRHGYQILAEQLQESITVYVNGEPQKSTVRADFLVRKGWKTYIVEVKSGQQGSIHQSATRRQLLEYELVYQPNGIILLDMEHHNLQKIAFAYPAQRHSTWRRYGVIGVLICMALYGWLQIF